MLESVSFKSESITFEINYLVELLGVMGIITKDQYAVKDMGRKRFNNPYHAKVFKKYVKDWKHAAVTQLRVFSEEKNFDYERPIKFILQMYYDLETDINELFEGENLPTKEDISIFKQQIYHFNEFIKFEKFFDANKTYYYSVVDCFMNVYNKYKPVEFLNKYFKFNNVHINLMLGITNDNYCMEVDDKLYVCLKPFALSQKEAPIFAKDNLDFVNIFFKKIGSIYVYRMLDDYLGVIDEMDLMMYHNILEELYGGQYLDAYIGDTIIKALECIFIEKIDPQISRRFYIRYSEQGYSRIRDVAKMIKEKGSNIEDYVCDIIKLFEIK